MIAPRLPHVPRLLDDEDARMLGRLAVYTLLAVWVAVVLALTLGFAWRLFLFAAYGG
jgi:hypothetical protein